jgi:hypothetical protein
MTRDPETDMSRPGIKPGPPLWEESNLAKSYSNSVLIAIQNIYIRARNNILFLDAPTQRVLTIDRGPSSPVVRMIWLLAHLPPSISRQQVVELADGSGGRG